MKEGICSSAVLQRYKARRDASISAGNDERQQKLREKKLPLPELPKGVELSMDNFTAFEATAKETLREVSLPEDKTQAHSIKFDELTGAHWMSVACNCLIFKGRTLKDFNSNGGDAAVEPLFTVPNVYFNDNHIFQPAQISLIAFTSATTESRHVDRAAMMGVEASASVQSPWISGSASFGANCSNKKLEKGESVTTTATYVFPVGYFNLPTDYHHAQKFPIKINPQFESDVCEMLDRKLKGDALRKAIQAKYGDFVALKPLVGLAAYTKETKETSKVQDLAAAARHFEAAVAGSFASASAAGKEKSKAETGIGTSKSTYRFTSIAGNLPNPNIPGSLANERRVPNAWRLVHMGDRLKPVVDFLSPTTRARLDKAAPTQEKVPAEAASKLPPWAFEGAVVKCGDAIYKIEKGKKRHYDCWGNYCSWGQPKLNYEGNEVGAIPNGLPMPWKDGAIVKSGNPIYMIKQNKKCHFPSWDIYASYGLGHGSWVYDGPDVARLADGTPMPKK